MSSTNKTSGLDLTQYIGVDIFNPLEDYNVDMGKLDTKITALSNTVPMKTIADITYYVSTTGLYTNDGLTSGTSFPTIKYAIDKIPQVVNHVITINVAAGTYPEDIVISGFSGKGSIYLIGSSTLETASNYNVLSCEIDNCSCVVEVKGLNFTSILKPSFCGNYCMNVRLFYTKAISISDTGVLIVGSKSADSNSEVYTTEVSGINNIVSYSSLANCKITAMSIMGQLSGRINMQYGGEIIGSDGKSTSGYSPNLLINGDFKVWQRGTTFNLATGGYTADRWKIYTDSSMTNVAYSAKLYCLNRLGGNGTFSAICQFIEDLSIIGKTVTMSAMIDGVVYSVTTVLGSQQSFIVKSGILEFDIGTAIYSNVNPAVNIAFLDKLDHQVSWVKLEVGSVPTPYVPRPIAEELAMCQRYFISCKKGWESTNVYQISLNDIYANFNIPEMRVVPTVNVDGSKIYVSGQNTNGITGFTIDSHGASMALISLHVVSTNNSVNVYGLQIAVDGAITLDSEIY